MLPLIVLQAERAGGGEGEVVGSDAGDEGAGSDGMGPKPVERDAGAIPVICGGTHV